MELPELEQGLQTIQQPLPQQIEQMSPEAYDLNGSFMNDFGYLFSNDNNLGELLLGQLRANNVDTKAATEAMLRELLKGVVQDMNSLSQKIGPFIAEMQQTIQKTQATADAIDTALTATNGDTIPPVKTPESAFMLSPEQAAPDDFNFGNGVEEVPSPEGAGDMPSPEGAGDMPSPEGAGDMTSPEGAGDMPSLPPPLDTESDAKQKNIKSPKYVTSDRRMKSIERAKFILSDLRMKKVEPVKTGLTINSNILAGCQGGF